MIELLAPAKDKETAMAAIDCGADAVYMGAPNFGARKNAPNSIEDIKEVVDYAHKFWARVHVALNTILTDAELDEAVKIAKQLSDIGIDALIIQDMGLLKRLIDMGFSTPVHMSTQCDNYLPEKVKFFNKIGVSRVILARELSLEQIKMIHKQNPNLEIETFVHGALCVSMSGQCYLSQYIGGRSANRGECAQPCRKKYSVITDNGKVLAKDVYALCLKDFNASNCLEELIDAGVCSFKIEGRLKDAGYVKNIVSYYKQKLGMTSSSGKSLYTYTPNPDKSFNRGFTEYFLKDRTDCFNFESPKSRGEYLGKVIEVGKNWFSVNTGKELHPQDGLYFNGKGCLVNKIEGARIYPNKPIEIKTGVDIYRNSDVDFERELAKPVKRQIGINVTFYDNTITLIDEDGVKITKKIEFGEKTKNSERMEETFIKQFSKTGESDFYINDINIKSELPFIKIGDLNAIRRNSFKELMAERLRIYKSKNKQKQSRMNYAEYYLKEMDYRANVLNKEAESFYKQCGCEITEPALEAEMPTRNVELMRCKHCIKYALNICKSPQSLVLVDEFGKQYPLKFDCKKCEMKIETPL